MGFLLGISLWCSSFLWVACCICCILSIIFLEKSESNNSSFLMTFFYRILRNNWDKTLPGILQGLSKISCPLIQLVFYLLRVSIPLTFSCDMTTWIYFLMYIAVYLVYNYWLGKRWFILLNLVTRIDICYCVDQGTILSPLV